MRYLFRRKILLISLLLAFFISSFLANARGMVIVYIDNSDGSEDKVMNKNVAPFVMTVQNGQSVGGNFDLVNFHSGWVEIEMTYVPVGAGNVLPREEVITYDDADSFTISADSVRQVDFTIQPPCGVEAGVYKLQYQAVIVSYENVGASDSDAELAVGSRIAIGAPLTLTITGDSQSCDQPNGRLVFHDLDGDGEYEPNDGDSLVDMGLAKIYDSDDNLLVTTDLSVTEGVYSVPQGNIVGQDDLYIVVETDKMDGDVLDTDWKGNFYVDRVGTASVLGNAYSITDVTDYSNVTDNVDLRSRNTDQQGDFNLSTMSIGPDDKDQVISPTRWDQTVEGTNFQYADLDHDGRVDPDDKDHIISPLYWDFPN